MTGVGAHFLQDLHPNWAQGSPWLRADSPAHGLGIDVERAVRQLERLFPVSVCRRVMRRSKGEPTAEMRLIYPLLMRSGWIQVAAAPLLFLGADLGECAGWEDHKPLVKRLRSPQQHLQARFEVALWAGMLRERVAATRIAEGVGKSADFELSEVGVRVAVEAKVLSRSLYARNLESLSRALTPGDREPGVYTTPPPPRPMPHQLRFLPSRKLMALLRDTDPERFERVYADPLLEFFRDWYASRGPRLVLGTREAPMDLGQFEILSPRDSMDSGITWWVEAPEATPQEDFRRALARVRNARAQLEGHEVDVRVAVVWTPTWSAPIEAVPHVLGPLLADHPHEYDHLDWIVVLNVRWGDSWNHGPVAAAFRVNASAPDVRQMAWYEGVRRWRLVY